ncbi:MAG: hypothetical protein QJR02_13125 [Sinobacteraceae bacterium]|nr:hypothetical protein [Nevskiaceae bacterium]
MHEPTANEFWTPPIWIAWALLCAGLSFFEGGYIFCLMRFGAPDFSGSISVRFIQITAPLLLGGALAFVSYRLARYPIIAFFVDDVQVLVYLTLKVRRISPEEIVKTDFRKRLSPRLWLRNGRSIRLNLKLLTKEDQNRIKDELLKRFGT